MSVDPSMLFEELKNRWPSTWVARREVGNFSGGILHPRTLANHDSAGTGPAGRIRVARTIAYPIDELLEWMRSRVREV